MPPTPYTIAVPDHQIETLRDRLRRTRWPTTVPGSAWLYGVDLDFLQELCTHWTDHFDWRAVETQLNRFPQFRTPLQSPNGETLRIHFIHRPSPRADAVPLLIQHGWPSSVYEFHKIIDALAEPQNPNAPAFHIIAPSLPGYGWSDIPRRAGLGPPAIADLWANLMSELGYPRFAYHGGDWGAAVGAQLGLRHPERLRALHLTAAALAPPGDAARPQSEQEQRFFRDEQEPYVRNDAAHRAIHGTRFQTLSYSLADSPVGLAAWIIDKWWMLSDCMRPEEAPRGGDLRRRFTIDELLATVSIYWFTETINSSMRIYHEAARPAAQIEAEIGGQVRLHEGQHVTVPTAFARLVRGTPLPPRSWCERAFNITHWTNFPEGGHFPAMEIPHRLLTDLQTFLPQHTPNPQQTTDAHPH